MGPPHHRRWPAELALLGTVSIWGLNFAVMKTAMEELQPFAFNALRLTLSTLFLGLLLKLESGQLRPPARGGRSPWPALALISLCGYTIYQFAFINGLHRTTAASSAMLLASAPIWAALGARLFLRDRLGPLALVGLAVGFGGMTLIALERGELDFSDRALVGNLLVVLAAVFWAAYTVQSQPLLSRISPTCLAFWGTALSMPFHLVAAWPHRAPLLEGGISPLTWSCIAYAGVLATGLAYVLWNRGVRGVGAAHAVVFTNLIPIAVLVMSATLLGERITAAHLAGGALILLGLFLVRRERVRH